MNVIDWLTATRRGASGLQHNVRALIDQADDQTDEAWEVVNQSRAARGEEPIAPPRPFHPRDLIDPGSEEDHG